VQDRGFPERLGVLLQENDFPPQFLVLDVTESLSLDGQNLLLDVFTRLRILGWVCRSITSVRGNLAHGALSNAVLGDQGGSLAHRGRASRARARVIVKAIVDLAHTLGLTACAEGWKPPRCWISCAMRVSTPRKADFLRACPGSGYRGHRADLAN